MLKGRIKWFNDIKGFGFIESQGAEDVFLHYSSVVDWDGKNLPEGAMVEFEIQDSERGLEARDVHLIVPESPLQVGLKPR